MSTEINYNLALLDPGAYEISAQAIGNKTINSEIILKEHIREITIQLTAPVLTIENQKTLIITDSQGYAEEFSVYINDTELLRTTDKTIDLSTFNLADGDHNITCVAYATNTQYITYLTSKQSEVVIYTIKTIDTYKITNSLGTYASYYTVKVNGTVLAKNASMNITEADTVTITSVNDPKSMLLINNLPISGGSSSNEGGSVKDLYYSEDIILTTYKDASYAHNFVNPLTIHFQSKSSVPAYTLSGSYEFIENPEIPTAFMGKWIPCVFVASPGVFDSDDNYYDSWNGPQCEMGIWFPASGNYSPGISYIWSRNHEEGTVRLADVYVSPTSSGNHYKGWRHAGYRTVSFCGNNTVSAGAYNWFIANTKNLSA